jgi:hypothetical protein
VTDAASQTDPPRRSAFVTIVVIGLSLVFWGAVVAEFLFAARAAMRVSAALARRQPWAIESFGRFAMRLLEQPYLLVIPFVLGVVLVGGSTWVIRHRMNAPRLSMAWSALMLLVPLVIGVVIWFGAIQPLAQQLQELTLQRKAAIGNHARMACTGSPSISGSGRCCRS